MTRKHWPEADLEQPKQIAADIREATNTARSKTLPPVEERYWSALPLGSSEDASRFPEEQGEAADRPDAPGRKD